MFKEIFSLNGMNALAAVAAAKISFLFSSSDSLCAKLTSFFAMLYAVLLFVNAAISFVRNTDSVSRSRETKDETERHTQHGGNRHGGKK